MQIIDTMCYFGKHDMESFCKVYLYMSVCLYQSASAKAILADKSKLSEYVRQQSIPCQTSGLEKDMVTHEDGECFDTFKSRETQYGSLVNVFLHIQKHTPRTQNSNNSENKDCYYSEMLVKVLDYIADIINERGEHA